MKVIIRYAKGNYFKQNTGIGPCFGATKKTAKRFDSAREAAIAMRHYAFAMCEIEKIE